LVRRREQAASLLPPEPQDGIVLGFRLPNGARLTRKFSTSQTVADLQNFVESKATENNLADVYSISSDFPKKTFHDQPPSLTLAEAGITGRMLLRVQERV